MILGYSWIPVDFDELIAQKSPDSEHSESGLFLTKT